MTSRPPTTTSTSTTATSSVRRNLFHHHLSRRPTTTSSSSTVSTTMADTDYPTQAQTNYSSHSIHTNHSIHPNQSIHPDHAGRANHGNPLDDSEGIIVMVNGKYDVQTLELPPQEEGEDGGGAGEMEEVEGERERLEKQLLEMYRNRSLQPGEPGELLAAVHASVRRKMAGLDADNWMFEGEGEGEGKG